MLEWKRTGKGEYPKNEQECLIYFYPIGYCNSKYFYDENAEYTKHMFCDKGGFLGDEDVLWVSSDDIKECTLSEDEVKKTLTIPQDYIDTFKPAHDAWKKRNNKSRLMKIINKIVNRVLRIVAFFEWAFVWKGPLDFSPAFDEQLDELLIAFMSEKIDKTITYGDYCIHILASGKYFLYADIKNDEYKFYEVTRDDTPVENIMMNLSSCGCPIKCFYSKRPSLYALNKVKRECIPEKMKEIKKRELEEKRKSQLECDKIKEKFKDRG